MQHTLDGEGQNHHDHTKPHAQRTVGGLATHPAMVAGRAMDERGEHLNGPRQDAPQRGEHERNVVHDADDGGVTVGLMRGPARSLTLHSGDR